MRKRPLNCNKCLLRSRCKVQAAMERRQAFHCEQSTRGEQVFTRIYLTRAQGQRGTRRALYIYPNTARQAKSAQHARTTTHPWPSKAQPNTASACECNRGELAVGLPVAGSSAAVAARLLLLCQVATRKTPVTGPLVKAHAWRFPRRRRRRRSCERGARAVACTHCRRRSTLLLLLLRAMRLQPATTRQKNGRWPA